jgi:hypothetical protein
MKGSYYLRPDGLAVVTHGDGWTSPALAVDELELEDAGLQRVEPPPPGLPPGALAANAHAAPPASRLDAGGGLGAPTGDDAALADWAQDQQLRAAVAKAAPKAPPGTHAAPAPAPPVIPQRGGPALAMQNFEGAQPVQAGPPGGVDPKRLRRVGGAPGAPGEAGAGDMAPRPMLVKGGMRMQSAVRQPGVEISPEVKAELLDDRRPEQYAESAARIAEQRDAMTLERESMALDQQRDIDQQMVQRQAIDRELAKKSQAIQKRERELERMEPQSVREYWNDRGSLARLGAIFTAAVGGYLQGLTGASRNSGLDQINELVSFDLAKQQDAWERGRDRRDSAKNEYAQAIELYGTPEAAALDFQMRRYAAAERLLAARAEKVGTEEYKQQAGQLVQELRTARAQKRMELEQLEKGRFLQENWLNVPDQYVGGAPKAKEEQVSMLADRMEKAGLGEKEEQLGAVADLISELPEGELPTEETRHLGSRITRWAADKIGGQGSGRALLDSPAERRAVAKVEQIKGKLRHELSGAAVSPQEQERLDAQLDQINTREGLERFRTDLQRKMERRKAGIRAGVAPEAVLEYERRRGAYNLPERPRSQRVDDQ